MIDTKRLRELLAECDELDCDNWDCETARQMKHHLPALLDELERLRAENQEQHERIGQLIYESGK